MTKIVYAASDISPEVYTPPRGVVMLPLEQHPAIAEDRAPVVPLPLPPGDYLTPQDNDFIRAIFDYIKAHGQADVIDLQQVTGSDYARIKGALYNNPTLFRRLGYHTKNGARCALWGLVEGARVQFRAGRPRSPDTQRIYDYFKTHGPATTAVIAEVTGIDQQRVKRLVEENRHMFCRVARIKGDKPGTRWVLWGIKDCAS